MNENRLIFKKTQSGLSFLCFKSETEYSMITVAAVKGASRYAYEKVTAPADRVKKVLEQDDMVDSTAEEFKAAAIAYTTFSDKLKINLNKQK